MHIGVDATCWQNNRGYGRHARALLGSMLAADRDNRYTFFMDSQELAESVPAGAEIRMVQSRTPTTEAASAQGRRSLSDMWRTSRTLSGPELDVLLYPTVYSYVPAFSRSRKIVIIHDVIAETYPQLTLPKRTARLFWKAKVALSRSQADALVTVSEYSRKLIVERFRVNPDRVFVVGEASDAVFRVISKPKLPTCMHSVGLNGSQRLVTYVGGFSPHKNLEALVSAFAHCRDRFPDARLILVGEHKKETFHSYYNTVAAQIKSLGLDNHAFFTGYMTDEDLANLLNLSSVLVLPSFMEGFGLPAVEAAACGCPVIATRASPLPELLGNGGIFIDPMGDDLTQALARVLDSKPLREQMGKSAQAAASRLTWEAAARDMLRVIQRITQQ